MGFELNGVKYKGITLTGDRALESWQADITAPDMQMGKKALVKGELVVGTGKAFEFAEYGIRKVDLLTDSEGVERYGIEFELREGTNLILISSAKGDTFLQTKHLVSLSEGIPLEIGTNLTAGGEIYALQSKGYLKIYFTETQDSESRIRFFVGKDNEL